MDHHRPSRARATRGNTLIESLVATTILVTAVLSLANIAVTTGELRVSGLAKAAAMHAVERELAAVSATKFSTMVATHNGRGFSVALPDMKGAVLVPLKGDPDRLPGSISVTAPTGDPAHLLEIRVRVDWQGRNGPQHVERTTRFSDLGAGS
jgi:hypothetical protein